MFIWLIYNFLNIKILINILFELSMSVWMNTGIPGCRASGKIKNVGLTLLLEEGLAYPYVSIEQAHVLYERIEYER